jgi:hypothetical protein
VSHGIEYSTTGFNADVPRSVKSSSQLWKTPKPTPTQQIGVIGMPGSGQLSGGFGLICQIEFEVIRPFPGEHTIMRTSILAIPITLLMCHSACPAEAPETNTRHAGSISGADSTNQFGFASVRGAHERSV